MLTALPRKNKYFTPEMTDELNMTLRNIDSRIENHTPTDLEPKLEVRKIYNKMDWETVDSSFIAGKILVLSMIITVPEDTDISQRTAVGRTAVSVPPTVISQACRTSDNLPIRLIIENGTIYLTGSELQKDDAVNIYEEIVLV